ncbi:MAG: molecular chaperone TorD family protein [Bacteroidetes bacterium]|nr:molecular chaperone TorD family protein [Bacteroidota bacterium]
MHLPTEVFDDFATMLSYPAEGQDRALQRCLHFLTSHTGETHCGAALAHLQSYAEAVQPMSIEEREELYTRSFDINPAAALELGWHLYGEQYERGAFLVTMREQLRRHGIPEEGELPDHITSVLRLLGRLDTHGRSAMYEQSVHRGLTVLRERWKDGENPYTHCLDALVALLMLLSPTHAGVNHHD